MARKLIKGEKMCPICKSCKEEIEHLSFSADVKHYGIFQYDYPNGEDWDTKDYGEWSDIKLDCPKCNITLFTDEEEAINFLKEDDDLQIIVKEKLKKIKNE